MPNFVRLLAGDLNPVAAFLDRKIAVEGDVITAVRLSEMFGGVVPAEVLGDAEPLTGEDARA